MFQTVWCYGTVAIAAIMVALGLLIMRRRLFVSRIAIGLVAAACSIALAGLLLFAMQSRAAVARLEMRNDYTILRAVTRLGSAVAHAESGQRGYLLTLDRSYLATFTLASEKVTLETKNFRDALAFDTDLAAEGERIVETIAQKMSEMGSTLTILDKKSRDDSIALVRTNQGLHLENVIDRQIDDLRAKVQTRVRELIQHDTTSDIRISLGTGALLLLAVLAIVAASILSAREQERRAESQREIETRNRALALAGEMADIGHWHLTIDPLGMVWSDQVFKIHGLEPGDVPPLAEAIDFYVEEDRPRVAAIVERAISTGEDYQVEARLVRADGTIVDVISRGMCERDADGRTTSIFGVFMDVTAIRQSEREIVKRNAMFALAGEITGIGHWRMTLPEMEVFWSDQVFRIHGVDPAEGHPTVRQASAFHHPDDRHLMKQLLDAAIATGEGQQYDGRVVRRDGTTIDVVSRAICETNSAGKVTSIFGRAPGCHRHPPVGTLAAKE